MSTSSIVRLLGVFATIGAAISFMFEGWNNLNDLSKYIFYFGFLLSIFLISEIKSLQGIQKVFCLLFIALAPSIFAQLGSFVLDQEHRIPEQVIEFSPLKVSNLSQLRVVVVTSFLLMSALLYRIFSRLVVKSPVGNVLILISSGLIFLIPERTPEFHVMGGVIMGILWIFGLRITGSSEMKPFLGSALLSSFLFFTGRACLYETNVLFYSYILLFLSFLFIRVMPKLVRETNDAAGFVFIGNILVILGSSQLASYFSLGSLGSYILSMILLSIALSLNLKHKSLGIGFLSFMGWYRLLVECFSSVAITERVVTTLVPVFLLGASYKVRHKASFQSNLLLVVVSVFKNLFEVIEFPKTNIWVVLALVSLSLFVLSFLIDKLKDVVGAKYKEIMNELE